MILSKIFWLKMSLNKYWKKKPEKNICSFKEMPQMRGLVWMKIILAPKLDFSHPNLEAIVFEIF